MHLSRFNIPNRNIHIYQNPTKRIDFFFFFFEKNKQGPRAYSEQKVVDKRLGNFVVIFIYLKERKGGGQSGAKFHTLHNYIFSNFSFYVDI